MIRVRQIKVNVKNCSRDVLIGKVIKKLNIHKEDIIKFVINKKSIDARDKNNIFYVYEIDLVLKNENKIKLSKDVFKVSEEKYNFVPDRNKNISPVIVGAGPSGLFCAYFLAKAGYKPLVIERGEEIENRIKTVEKFWKSGILDENSNVQFGEGGAGTFSDGKLNTLVKDKNLRMKKVFEIFVKCGAPREIMYDKNPHIGTDILRKVIVNMRNKIIEMGGTFIYNSTLTDIICENNEIKKIEINNNKVLPCKTLVLAIGHSARDTFRMLYKRNLKMSAKPFAIGTRIEHSQDFIDKMQYGENRNYLPPANYKLTYQTPDGKGVYTFCMCPGGYVINSSSSNGLLVVNGMSNYKRDSKKANSAIVVTVNKKDYGEDIFSGINFQEKLEKLFYLKGNGKILIQTFEDFKNGTCYGKMNQYNPSIKGDFCYGNLSEVFPDFIKSAIISGIYDFDKKIKGFKSGLLIGLETRTSSPIRIDRDDNLMSNIKGIYPCGEGSGYSGGITTSAMDGIKVFEKLTS